MKSVVFYNKKGGVGKTTFAGHCALYAAEYHRLRTVAIGLDRQGDILRWISGGEVWVGDGTVHQHSPNLTVIYSPNQQPNLRPRSVAAWNTRHKPSPVRVRPMAPRLT